jgi:signal transduction histidine kinase
MAVRPMASRLTVPRSALDSTVAGAGDVTPMCDRLAMSFVDEWQRPGPTVRQRRVDLAIGLGVAALGVLNLVLSRSVGLFATHASPAAAEQICWVLAVTLPLIWRRSHPEIAAVIVAIAFIGGQVRGVQEQQVSSGAIFAALYALGAWGRDRPRARWLRLVIIGSMFVWLFVAWILAHDQMPAGGPPGASGDLPPLLAGIVNGVIINALIFGFAYLFGETAWLAARRQHQLEAQAEELRAAQALAGERAMLGERVRIARELHDVVAHHVSVMGIQASAARRAIDKDSGKMRTALSAVEQSARTAVEELHRMLGALRASDRESEPPAGVGLDRVEDLTSRVRDAGLTAQYAVYGIPAPLPDSVSQAAYRIIQEAVTNTLKHGRASTVDVRIRYLERELEIDVTDDGHGGPGTATTTGGRGLIGMRERAAVHGGTVEAGPRTAGGYRVRAHLPMAASSPDPAPATAEAEDGSADATAPSAAASSGGTQAESTTPTDGTSARATAPAHGTATGTAGSAGGAPGGAALPGGAPGGGAALPGDAAGGGAALPGGAAAGPGRHE